MRNPNKNAVTIYFSLGFVPFNYPDYYIRYFWAKANYPIFDYDTFVIDQQGRTRGASDPI